MNHIIKRKGHRESFDERKVYASCYAACLNAHRPKERAEEICGNVAASVRKWIHDRAEVDSDTLFRKITEVLTMHDADAAFLYETHRDIS